MKSGLLNHILQQMSNPPAIHLGEIAVDYSALIAKYLPQNVHVICDIHTQQSLPYPTLCFETSPKADRETVERIRQQTAQADALIAVGSGTINDLVKYASFLDGKPYLVIATAPSMNGYVSANASISEGGHKHTLPAHSPIAVLADIPTLAAAPRELILAGIGDTLCRSTVQADWLLSHLLLGTPYEPMYFEWMKESEEQLLSSLRAQRSNPDWIAASAAPPRNDGFIKQLFEALLVSGLAMRHYGSSAPASQGEHMIAHTREMLLPDLPSHFHGLEIAVTTVTMAKWQEKILNSPTAPHISYAEAPERFRAEYLQKFPNAEMAKTLNQKLQQEWPEIRTQIQAIHRPSNELIKLFESIDCKSYPQDLGWPDDAYQQVLHTARFTRNRFTFLDLKL